MENPMDLLSLASHNPPHVPSYSLKDPKPSHLNTATTSGSFRSISADKTTVKYVQKNRHHHDVGAVQSDLPAPTRTTAYYFEMTVVNRGEKGQVAIGFTGKGYNLCRQPGWEANSCGYHGDDGSIFNQRGTGDPFGPTYTTNDTVGAGINYTAQEFFFTKNGKLIGTIKKEIKGPLYPTVAVHSYDEEVTVNFGKQAFLFDIKSYKSEEKLKQQKVVEKLSVPFNISHWIVRSYLLHYGYQGTVNSLDIGSGTLLPSTSAQEHGINEGDAYALEQRAKLRQLIRSGNIDSAFQNIREWYPQIIQGNTSTISFLLHYQKFIEYIQNGQLEESVSYARAELQKFLNIPPFQVMLENAFALLAYPNSKESEFHYLLKESQREFVADAVNAAILSTNPNLSTSGNCLYSRLEKILRQLTASILERRALNDNEGEAFDLHGELLRWGWEDQGI